MSEEKQLSLKTEKQLQGNEYTEPSIMMLAQNPDFPVDKLKMLIDMKNKEEDRAARREFEYHFAEMQGEFEPILRTKKGYNFTYADLAMMEKKYRPIISKHKFSYRWTKEPLETGETRYRIQISGYGWTDSNSFFDVPKIEAGKMQNDIQSAGAAQEYGRRQSFKLGFAITEIGEDTDAELTFNDGTEYAWIEQRLSACTTKEAVNAEASTIKKELTEKKDDHGIEVLRTLYMHRKKELEK